MKNISYYFFPIPVLYAASMIYQRATMADALIVCAFCGLVGFFHYLKTKYTVTASENTEISKLEEELKIETMKTRIEQLKESSIRDRAIRDARNAAMGYEEGKALKF